MRFFLLGLLPPCILSYLLISASLNRHISGPRWALVLLKSVLALGLALGGTSCLFFLWLVVIGNPTPLYGLFEPLLFGVSAIMWIVFLRSHRQTTHEPSHSPDTPYRGLWLVLLVGFWYTLSTRLIRFVFLSLNSPLGHDDAVGIWNLRARYLFAGGDEWREPLTNALSRSSTPDYPLLLPATIARLWTYWGEDSQIVPVTVAFLFTFAIVGLGLASLTILRSRSQGLLAGIVLVGTSFFIMHGTTQYADVPLGFYFMATLVLCCIYDKSETGKHSILVLTGFMAGLAAWTKNEGGLFVLVVIIARLAALVPLEGWRASTQQLLALGAGLAPIAMLLVFFKTQIAPATFLLVSQGVGSVLTRIGNVSSYLEVGRAMAGKALRVGHPGLTLLVGYWWLIGGATLHKPKPFIRMPAIALSLMLFGYFMAIIITPFNSVTYQLATSLDRLWLHLWPSTVLVFFLFVKTPEEALTPTSLPSG